MSDLVNGRYSESLNSEIMADNVVLVVWADCNESTVVTSGGQVYLWGGRRQKWDALPLNMESAHPLSVEVLGLAANITNLARAGRWCEVWRKSTTAFALGMHADFAQWLHNTVQLRLSGRSDA